MGIGITGIVQGLSGSSDSDLYGTRPVVPGRIDYTSDLNDAIATNMAMLPSLRELGLASTDVFTAMQERALPGYTGLRDSTTGVLASKLRGEIPRDVQQLLERNAAEKGITMGTSGSDLNQFDELRNLGLTSLAIQNQGLQQTSSWLAQNRGNAFDFTKMFLGKEDAIRRSEFNWGRDWLASQVKAAPDPQTRGAWDTEMGFIGEILSVYGGGAGYQQTYRGGGSGSGGGGGGSDSGYRGGPTGYDSFFGGGGGGDLPDGITSGAEY